MIPGKYDLSSTESESDSEILAVFNAIKEVCSFFHLSIFFFAECPLAKAESYCDCDVLTLILRFAVHGSQVRFFTDCGTRTTHLYFLGSI